MQSCYLCKSKNVKVFHKGVRDNANIDVIKCEKCGLLFLSDIFHLEDNFYKGGGMHKNQYDITQDEITNQSWEAWRAETKEDDIRRRESLREKCLGKTVLDFGCGNGGFLKEIRKDASLAVGVELDDWAREKMQEEEIKVKSRIEEWEGNKFDIITMFQVIEHLNNPMEYLEKIYSFLTEDGVLIVETPNAEDALISLYNCDEFKDFTFWGEHIFLYNSENLRTLICNNNRFEIVSPGQIQRYPLANHLYWLANGKPGGHKKWMEFCDYELNRVYTEILKNRKQCDTLFFEFRKNDIGIYER